MSTNTAPCVFVTEAGSPQEAWSARALVRSIRAFAGPLSDCPVLVLYSGISATEVAGPGVEDVGVRVESFVDRQILRAYWNSCTYALNPALGLSREWYERFRRLVADGAYQTRCCQDEWRRIFLHQAVWSTLVARDIPEARIRALPPAYGYPLHLHQDLAERRVATLNEVVSVIGADVDGDWAGMTDAAIHEPLRSWLLAPGEP